MTVEPLPLSDDQRLQAIFDAWPEGYALQTWPRSVWLHDVAIRLRELYPDASSDRLTLTARLAAPFPLALPRCAVSAAAVTTFGLTPGAWGFPRVAGRCPSCGAASLFLAVGGYVTCAVIGCADPCAAADLLDPPAVPLALPGVP